MTTPTDSFAAVVAELRILDPDRFEYLGLLKVIQETALRIERLDAEMRKELDTLYTRCYAAVSLIPGDKLVGNLQTAADDLSQLRARLAACEDGPVVIDIATARLRARWAFESLGIKVRNVHSEEAQLLLYPPIPIVHIDVALDIAELASHPSPGAMGGEGEK